MRLYELNNEWISILKQVLVPEKNIEQYLQ